MDAPEYEFLLVERGLVEQDAPVAIGARGLWELWSALPTPTKKRKMLRTKTLSRWELRLGKHRVFYDVDEKRSQVKAIAVGHKEHNDLFIRGQKVNL